MKTEINIATSNGYILSNGKLTAYEFNSARVNFATGEVEYDCILGGVPTTFKTKECPDVYKDESAYQREEMIRAHLCTWEVMLRDTIGRLPYGFSEDEDSVPAYCIVNGEIIAKPFPKEGFVIAKSGKRTYEGKEKFYSTRDEAMLYCDIIKVECDGTETRLPSPASLVQLDEEQMVAFKAVEDALARASELGVKFACDTENETLYAYSDKHIKAYYYEYDCDNYITSFGVRINELMTEMSLSPMCASLCETQVYAKFKEE